MILKFYLSYYLKIFEVDNFVWTNSLFKLLGLYLLVLLEDEQKVSVGEFDEANYFYIFVPLYLIFIIILCSIVPLFGLF